MRLVLVVAAHATATLLSGCGPYDLDDDGCHRRCNNIARIFAVDSAGNRLTISAVTENNMLLAVQGSCELEFLPAPLPATVLSRCRRFGADIVSTDGKRFSGVIDLNPGFDTAPVCGTVCKTREVTVPLE